MLCERKKMMDACSYLDGDGGFGALDAIGNADHQPIGIFGFPVQRVPKSQSAGVLFQLELAGVAGGTFHQAVLERTERVRIGGRYLRHQLANG